MLRISLTVILLFVASLAGAEGEYVADKLDKLIERECENCPSAIGEMFIVTPAQENTGFPKENIVVESCGATLLSPTRIITAAHCAKRWLQDGWSDMAKGDCSKAFVFYFPQTSAHPFERARCKSIVSPIYLRSGNEQEEPDHLLIDLDREVQRSSFQLDPSRPQADEIYDIWAYDWTEKKYVQRSCRALTNTSMFTPLSYYDRGAYDTLTCDGDLQPGWSGSSLTNSQGKTIGTVSFGFGETAFGTALFGYNEANISLARCVSETQSPSSCYADPADLLSALHRMYVEAIHVAVEWHAITIEMLNRASRLTRFTYVRSPVAQGDFPESPAFEASCAERADNMLQTEYVVYVLGDMSTLQPKQIIFNSDSTVGGVNVSGAYGGGGNFNLGVIFKRFKPTAIRETGLYFETNDPTLPRNAIEVPFCN